MPRRSSTPHVPVRTNLSSQVHQPQVHQPQVHQPQVQPPGFISNMVQGFALGTGQSIATNIFRSPTEVKHVHNTDLNTTPLPKEYTECIKEYNDRAYCKSYLTESK